MSAKLFQCTEILLADISEKKQALWTPEGVLGIFLAGGRRDGWKVLLAYNDSLLFFSIYFWNL